MSDERRQPLGYRLYSGETSVRIVERRKTWYLLSAVIVLVSIIAVFVQGVNFSIEFRGGADFQTDVPKQAGTPNEVITDVREAVFDTGTTDGSEPIVTAIGTDKIRVETPPLTTSETTEVRKAIGSELGVGHKSVNYSSIGPTWGEQITQKAITALLVFLALVMLVIWLYFREWRMSVSAIVALLHDLAITVGVYALVGFDVTPATIIGVLTILGYSLYDTVVVFDKVRENTNAITATNRQTYSEAANHAVNQTLVRSINTSVIALLPIAGILFVGAGLLGAGTLKDLALALFIGVAAGTYSSIFIATPFLCTVKERDPAMVALRRRVAARRRSDAAKAGESTAEPAVSTAAKAEGDREPVVVTASSSTNAAAAHPAPAPGERSQPKRKPRSSRKSRSKGNR